LKIRNPLEKFEPYRTRADAALRRHQPLSTDAALARAMDYALFPGGKRLRPIVVYLCAELCGDSGNDTDPVACAVEFLHTASLILDDLPHMDDTAHRRGRSAMHAVFGPNATVLAAHSFVSLCFEAVSGSDLTDRQVRTIVSEFARLIGPRGMASGQMKDLGGVAGLGAAPALEVAMEKTGLLFGACSYAGAIAAGAQAGLAAGLREFGLALGRAYQILDDLKDSGGEDRPERSVNIVHNVGEPQARKLMDEELDRAGRVLADVGGWPPLEEFLQILRSSAESLRS
jgi:geranylgeranyl pyrophosphate synthase